MVVVDSHTCRSHTSNTAALGRAIHSSVLVLVFCLQQGARATRSFLRQYVKKNDPPLKGAHRIDSDALTKPLHA